MQCCCKCGTLNSFSSSCSKMFSREKECCRLELFHVFFCLILNEVLSRIHLFYRLILLFVVYFLYLDLDILSSTNSVSNSFFSTWISQGTSISYVFCWHWLSNSHSSLSPAFVSVIRQIPSVLVDSLSLQHHTIGLTTKFSDDSRSSCQFRLLALLQLTLLLSSTVSMENDWLSDLHWARRCVCDNIWLHSDYILIVQGVSEMRISFFRSMTRSVSLSQLLT